MALPLVSTMTIENMNSYLEGTMINCTGLNSSSVSSVVLMTTIHVFDNDRGRYKCYNYDIVYTDCIYLFMALSMQMLPILLRLS